MKPNISIHFATICRTPVEAAKALIHTINEQGGKLGNWYGQLVKGCYDSNENNEYDLAYEVSDLKDEKDLISRIRKNGTGWWNIYTDIFSNEEIYISVFPASHNMKTTSVIVEIAGNTSNGELASFMQIKNEYYKRAQQLDFFESIAQSISADYYGIWATETLIQPLESHRFYSNSSSLFFIRWKQKTLNEKLIQKNYHLLKTDIKPHKINFKCQLTFVWKR